MSQTHDDVNAANEARPQVIPATSQTAEASEPEEQIPTPPLTESLVALGLIAIVAVSFWVYYGPLIEGMWRTMMNQR